MPNDIQATADTLQQDQRPRTVSKGVNFKTGEGLKTGPWHSTQEMTDYFDQLIAEDYDNEI